MKINVGKIISIRNNNYVILGLDNVKYEFFDKDNNFKKNELIYFRGEKINDFHKAFFLGKLEDISNQEKQYIADLLKNGNRKK